MYNYLSITYDSYLCMPHHMHLHATLIIAAASTTAASEAKRNGYDEIGGGGQHRSQGVDAGGGFHAADMSSVYPDSSPPYVTTKAGGY
jgi:hypothetical protein